MKKLSKHLKKMMDALAYAHAGEHLSRRDKMRSMPSNGDVSKVIPETPAAAASKTGKQARRIALYVGNELPAEVMEYVIETCSRLQHDLTVLSFQTDTTGRDLMAPHLEALADAGIDMELITLSGEPITGMARYLRRRPDVAFMACKDSGYLGRSFLHGTQRKNVLPVPVVVVTTKKPGETEEQTAPAKDNGANVA